MFITTYILQIPTKFTLGPKGELSYSSTLFSTSTLDWGGWSEPHPDRFNAGK